MSQRRRRMPSDMQRRAKRIAPPPGIDTSRRDLDIRSPLADRQPITGRRFRLRRGQDLDRPAGLLDRRLGGLGRAEDLEGELRLEFAIAEDLHAVPRLGDHAGGDRAPRR